MEKENDNYKTDDGGFLQKVALQSLDGFLNQSGTIIPGNYFNAGRQRTLDLCQLSFHTIDDRQGVHAVTHHYNSADSFSFTLPLCDPLSHVRTERNIA